MKDKRINYLPKTIKLGLKTYSITQNEKNVDPNLFGEVRYGLDEIYLKPVLSEYEKRQTLCHEAAHIKMFELGISYNFDDKECEVWAQFIGTTIMDLILQNPGVVAWIQDYNIKQD